MEHTEDPNCIVKAFENYNVFIFKEDSGEKPIYYFKASDIASILDLTNIRVSIQNYEEDEKVVRKAYSSNSGNQDVLFLTSRGIYRLLYNSKKPLAKKFRNWVGDILDDIIFNDSKRLKEQLENQQKLLEEKDKQLENKDKQIIENMHQSKVQRENALVKANSKTNLVYIAETVLEVNGVKDNYIKIGETTDVETRCKKLRSEYGRNTYIIEVFKVERSIEFEKKLFDNIHIKQVLKKIIINSVEKKEILQLTSHFTLLMLKNIINNELESFKKEYYNTLIREHKISKLEIDNLKLEIEKLTIELKYEKIKNSMNIPNYNETDHIKLKNDYDKIKNDYIKLENQYNNIINNLDEKTKYKIFLKNTVEYTEQNRVGVKSIDLILLFLNHGKFSKYNNQLMTKYKNILEEYIKETYTNIRNEQHTINTLNKTIKGYSNLIIKEKYNECLTKLQKEYELYNKK